MSYSFELLAEERQSIESTGLDAAKWNWQAHASHLRRDVEKNEDLTPRRSEFLIRHAMELDGVSLADALKEPKKAKGKASILACPTRELKSAGLFNPLPDVAHLPAYSAAITLRFQLLSPLLTRDDDPFYLFDNPVRKDHIYGAPFLAAASVKGLAADAVQRGFPLAQEWLSLGGNDQQRTTAYRRQQGLARRLFGLASDGDEFASEAGRLHFAPVWFSHIQYLVMNPARNDNSGIGTLPIQFEAIAAVDDKGRAVQAEASFFYFNPAGSRESDLATVCGDLACFVGALAAWWPALGLGAKRLAGYGALVPVGAECTAKDWPGLSQPLKFSGDDSWQMLAQKIASMAKGKK